METVISSILLAMNLDGTTADIASQNTLNDFATSCQSTPVAPSSLTVPLKLRDAAGLFVVYLFGLMIGIFLVGVKSVVTYFRNNSKFSMDGLKRFGLQLEKIEYKNPSRQRKQRFQPRMLQESDLKNRRDIAERMSKDEPDLVMFSGMDLHLPSSLPPSLSLSHTHSSSFFNPYLSLAVYIVIILC